MEVTGPDYLIAAAQKFVEQGGNEWAKHFQDFVIELAMQDPPPSMDDVRPHEETAIQIVRVAAAACIDANDMRAFNDVMGTLLPWVSRYEQFIHMTRSRLSEDDVSPDRLDRMPWE